MGGAVARVASVVAPRPKPPTPTPTPAPIAVAPSVVEVSQATATNMDGYDNRKTKRQGRSSTILTSSTGVEGETTLGKKSLLGS